MTGPKLGYFDMNGAVEVFTQRAVTLHKRQWDTPSPCRCIGRLNVVHFADAMQRKRSCRDFWAIRVGAAVVQKGSGAVSTTSDAQRDFAALGQLGLMARPSVFDRLRLGRGEALADPLGAA